MNKKIFKYLLLAVVCFLSGIISTYAIDYTVENIPNPKQVSQDNYVSNPDGILNQSTVSEINNILADLELETNSEVAVVAVNSIGNIDIKPFAIQLFEKWGIGKSKHDNGLLILLVKGQRAVTFEVGYGLEGVLPDAICKRIQVNYMIPEFKNDDYNSGMLAGLKHTVSTIEDEKFETIKEEINWSVVLPMVFALYIIYVLITWLMIKNAGRKVKQDKKLSNNLARYKEMQKKLKTIITFMGFILPLIIFIFTMFYSRVEYMVLAIFLPLFSIPSYITGRRLMKKFRREPIPCNKCDGVMHLLSEEEEDKYLTEAQKFEEKIKSVDHDVFLCDKCNNFTVLSYDEKSIYTKCPNCGTKAFYVESSRTIKQPTHRSDGLKRTTYHCKYCGFRNHKDSAIPKINTPPVIITGGGHSGGGGFRGGGSFGGGRSGGGGATSRW